MIYDCFTFFNELDLLEIRLNILKDSVDRFVLVEATKTHQGKAKPLYFLEQKSRYLNFLDKIIHVIVDEYPDYEGRPALVLERHQRNMILNGLASCRPDDVILISDVDEIPEPRKVRQFKDRPGIKMFKQRMFYYYLNCMNVAHAGAYRWNGTAMVNYADLSKPHDFRTLRIALLGLNHDRFIHRIYRNVWKWLNLDLMGKRVVFVPDGGWHFSFLGGVEAIIEKIEAFSHTEYNTPEFKNAEKIREAIHRGTDIFGRDFSYACVPQDGNLPDYIVRNRDKYRHLIKN